MHQYFKSLGCLLLLIFSTTSIQAQPPCTLSLDSIYLDTLQSDCNHLFFKYKYSGGTPSAYKWTYGDGNSCGCYKPHNTYTKNGTFMVCGRIQDANGCADSLCLPFTVYCSNPCDLSPIGIYSYDTVSYNCRDYEFVAWISANAKRKVWLFGDGDSANTSFATHTFYKNGTYHAQMIVQDSIGCGDTAKLEITVDCGSNLPCPLSIQSIDTMSLSDCWTKQFKANCNKLPLSAWWQYGDNNSGLSPLITQHTYADTGLYALALYVKDSSGCADTFFRKVAVYCPKPNSNLPTFVDDLSALKVYPMPVVNDLHIDWAEDAYFTIADLTGKAVIQSTLQASKTIDCSRLNSGLYCLIVSTQNRIYKSYFTKL